MKVVIAPDKFAGTLSAAEAAAAMVEGWRAARPGDEMTAVPLADGGEGTLAVVEAAVPAAQRRPAEVADALGRAVKATWLLLPDGTALVEAAQACGLSRLDPSERNPLLATSYGVGQLMAKAAAEGARRIVVGLGGSATVDGGAGMAIALGHRVRRADGNGVRVGGQFLAEVAHVVVGARLDARVEAAIDVTNPLLGEQGAAAVFGPQKGARPRDVAVLEAALTAWADVVERDVPGGPWRALPGAGAAGGLGFGLAALAGARLVGGAGLVAGLVGLDAALDRADVVLTGEGRLDAQTAGGKTPAFVAEQGRAAGARVLAIAGQVAEGAGSAFDRAVALGPDGMTAAAALVAERAHDLAAEFAHGDAWAGSLTAGPGKQDDVP